MFTCINGIQLHPSMTDTAIIAPILRSNAALANHLMGETAKAPPTGLLLTAKQMNDLSYKAEGKGQNIIFEFAILSNIAVIEHQLGKVSVGICCRSEGPLATMSCPGLSAECQLDSMIAKAA